MPIPIRFSSLMLSAVLVAPVFVEPAAAQQTAIRDFGQAGDVFWDALYPDGFTELYCGHPVAAREAHDIEHVFPAFWMTKAMGCGTRRTCRRNDLAFNRMEADLLSSWAESRRLAMRHGTCRKSRKAVIRSRCRNQPVSRPVTGGYW